MTPITADAVPRHMCGRFTLHSRLNRLLRQFALQAGPEWAPRYNIAPTQSVPIVRMSNLTNEREMVALRWGLIPSWAKDMSIGSRMINARGETVAVKPSFRAAFKRRRCLVPADGYYEWQRTESGKQPFYIHLPDESLFAMAGLWESWHTNCEDALETFTVITTTAADATADVHDRMPVIVSPDDYAMWLDPESEDREALQSMLKPYTGDDLRIDAVTTHVNSPRNDDPRCIASKGC